MLHPFLARDASQWHRKLKEIKINHQNHTGYKILEIFKKQEPEVLISKINQGPDVIKRIK
jgi:hypothetical protein